MVTLWRNGGNHHPLCSYSPPISWVLTLPRLWGQAEQDWMWVFTRPFPVHARNGSGWRNYTVQLISSQLLTIETIKIPQKHWESVPQKGYREIFMSLCLEGGLSSEEVAIVSVLYLLYTKRALKYCCTK